MCALLWASASSGILRTAFAEKRLQLTPSPQQRTQMLYFLLCMGDSHEEVTVSNSLDVLDPVESRIIGTQSLLGTFLSNSPILQMGILRPRG